MKLFIKKCVIFFFITLVVYIGSYQLYYYYNTPKGKDVVYIWGDSQMCQGIDLKYLNANSHNFYSAAQHGAGLYDLLAFCNTVPDNSNVIVQISRPALLRRKKVDRNISALSIAALKTMYHNNYTFEELYPIVKNNLLPNKLFSQSNYLYPDADTVTYANPLSDFQTLYANKPNYLEDKEYIYCTAIETLSKKHCKIIALVFPYDSVLSTIENNSSYNKELAGFDNRIAAYFTEKKEFQIPADKNIFFDLTHLNTRGARYLTKNIMSDLTFSNRSLIIRITPTKAR